MSWPGKCQGPSTKSYVLQAESKPNQVCERHKDAGDQRPIVPLLDGPGESFLRTLHTSCASWDSWRVEIAGLMHENKAASGSGIVLVPRLRRAAESPWNRGIASPISPRTLLKIAGPWITALKARNDNVLLKKYEQDLQGSLFRQNDRFSSYFNLDKCKHTSHIRMNWILEVRGLHLLLQQQLLQ